MNVIHDDFIRILKSSPLKEGKSMSNPVKALLINPVNQPDPALGV
jgi:hypothetical protein